jgi:hypothetical protein
VLLHIPNWGYVGGGIRPAPDMVVNTSSTNITSGDLMDTVTFESLSLTTTNGSITMGVSHFLVVSLTI